MRDFEHSGVPGELDAALKLVQSELPPLGNEVESVLAVVIYATGQLTAAIDRLAARQSS